MANRVHWLTNQLNQNPISASAYDSSKKSIRVEIRAERCGLGVDESSPIKNPTFTRSQIHRETKLHISSRTFEKFSKKTWGLVKRVTDEKIEIKNFERFLSSVKRITIDVLRNMRIAILSKLKSVCSTTDL